MTESEVNSFLEFHARGEMPAGVLEPVVTIEEAGRLRGRALVDLDEVKKANAGEGGLGMLGPAVGPGAGRGDRHAAHRKRRGAVQLEQALVSGVPVPKAVLQQVVSYYSRTPRTPRASTSRRRSALPVNIRQIETLRGQAIIVQ